jgi:hypothetical protein
MHPGREKDYEKEERERFIVGKKEGRHLVLRGPSSGEI